MMKQPFRFTFFLLICLTLPLIATAQDGLIEADGLIEDFDDIELMDEDDGPTNIPDRNLRAAIETTLDIASGTPIIPLSLIATLTHLDAKNSNITDLTGLEHATSLTTLNLGAEYVEGQGWINSNSISDLSPLAGLTNLTELWLQRNNISDISAVAGLTNLTDLGLRYNAITDVSAVVHLTNLTDLTLDHNSISDISAVVGLTNLTWLGLSNNDLTDISAVMGLTNLRRLALVENNISDISAVAELTNLTGLWLWDNSISDISVLADLTNLTELYLQHNNISDLLPLVANTGLGSGDEVHVQRNPLNRASIETHIPALQSRGVTVEYDILLEEPVNIPDANLRAKIADALGKAPGDPITTADMARLTRLDVQNANISDLTGLEFATDLTWLILNNNNISDLSPLEGLINLMFLWLDSNNISDLSPLVANTGLGNGDTVIVNTNPLSAVSIKTHIPALESRGVRILADIPDDNLRAAVGDALGKAKNEAILRSDMANLTHLDARNAGINDLTGLEAATNLTGLNLGAEYVEGQGWINSNSVSDLSPLAGLTNLVELYLRNNSVSDISAVAGLTNLGGLSLQDNNISDISALSRLTNLANLFLGNNSISDISPLAELSRLGFLGLGNNNISDISAVAGLTNLSFLHLDNNTISDISAVAGLTNLAFLTLESNTISDISAVAGLTNLRFLLLVDNSISDLSPLVENMGLGEEDRIGVERNPLSFLSIYTHIPALQSRGAGVGFDPLQPDLLSGHNDGVDSVAFSSDGTLASGSRDGTVRLWDVATEHLKDTLIGHTAGVRSVTFSPDGTALASGSRDGVVILWDVATGRPKATLTEHTAWVESVAFSPDGSALASGSHDNTMHVWDVATERPTFTLKELSSIWGVAFSPDGTLAVGGDDGSIGLWDVANGHLKATLTEHTAWVESVAFSPDGSLLASGSGDSTVRLWDISTGQSIATLTGHTSWVRSVAFSPDGSLLASGSGDGTVRLWEIAPPPLEFLLSIPDGISLIHVPLKVTAVDGMPKTITSIANLYDALGGAAIVNFLITYDSSTQEWYSYVVPSHKDTRANRTLTDDMGIIAGLKAPVSVSLTGNPLGTDGNSTITLDQRLNLVGIPLKDERITRVSDLLRLDGIWGNVASVTYFDDEQPKTVEQLGDDGDIPLTGGQGFILIAQRAAKVTIFGDGWTNNTLPTAAASSVALRDIEVRDTTPVLALRGAVIDEHSGSYKPGLRVIVNNLSTDRAAATVTKPDEAGYGLTFVDIEMGRAARIRDTLEISAQSADPFIRVQPLRYTITAEDVKQSYIQLPELVAYEIPAETVLLHNYPNPFNPETWIPYRLAEDAFVTLTIYDQTGKIVRTLDVGHRVAAVYESRSKAVYWDGRNEVGETVASGVYFYHLSAGDYSATRKMLIIK